MISIFHFSILLMLDTIIGSWLACRWRHKGLVSRIFSRRHGHDSLPVIDDASATIEGTDEE